ncbi:MAG: hypothetical protein ACXWC4_09800 [Telluria sp.]
MTQRTVQQWEQTFRSWMGGPGDTESQRCENAETMIRKAIKASDELKNLDIEIFSQGSFKNITNIPQESDVDVSVCMHEWFYYELPEDTSAGDFGIVPANPAHSYPKYKEQIVEAISSYFGPENISPGNKAIRIHSNTYRVDADVVANVEYRLFDNDGEYREGVRFVSDGGELITNWPKQHIENGIIKNSHTAKRFKRMARILKMLQVEMLAEGKLDRRRPSFFLESLVFNVPDELFGHPDYYDDVRAILAHIFNSTLPNENPQEWTEVNGIKYLFHPSQPWSQSDAFEFASAAWDYIGFE